MSHFFQNSIRNLSREMCMSVYVNIGVYVCVLCSCVDVCDCICIICNVCLFVCIIIYVYVCECTCLHMHLCVCWFFSSIRYKTFSFHQSKEDTWNNMRIQPMISRGPKQPSKITAFFCSGVLYFHPSPCSPIHGEENLHARSKYRVIYVNHICTQVAEALRPHQ